MPLDIEFCGTRPPIGPRPGILLGGIHCPVRIPTATPPVVVL